MAMNLYVGNLSYQVTESELNNIFGAYGEVQSAKIIMDRETGRSKVSVSWKWPTGAKANKLLPASMARKSREGL